MPVSKIKNQNSPIRQAQGKQVKTTTQKPKVAATTVRKSVKTVTAGLSVPVYGLTGVKKGTIQLPEAIFGAKVNVKLMAQAVRVYQVNQRQGTASTKTRGQVRASTRKIYRQKGTGKARHGGITAPIFVGGGTAFGPHPRNFELKFSKQMRKKSLVSALAQRFSEDRIRVVDVNGATGKTSQIHTLFENLNLLDKKKGAKILFIAQSEAARAAKNIRGVEVSPAALINTYVVLNCNNLVFSKEAITELENVFIKKYD